MRDVRSGSSRLRALSAMFALLAIVAGGVVWSGCGSSNDTSESTATAKQEVEAGVKKAEEGVTEGTEEAQAEKGIQEAKKQAEKYLP